MKKQEEINITDVLTLIIGEITAFSPVYEHILTDQILVCAGMNRKNSRGGMYGKVVPLRFEDGSAVARHRGRLYTMPAVRYREREILYLVYFYMPKFFNLKPREKLKVIFHELYHISPDFNGDIRRMGKGKAAHGHSRRHFDTLFEDEMLRFYSYIRETPYMKFLSLSATQLQRHFHRVSARKMRAPRPIPAQGDLDN